MSWSLLRTKVNLPSHRHRLIGLIAGQFIEEDGLTARFFLEPIKKVGRQLVFGFPDALAGPAAHLFRRDDDDLETLGFFQFRSQHWLQRIHSRLKGLGGQKRGHREKRDPFDVRDQAWAFAVNIGRLVTGFKRHMRGPGLATCQQ